MIFMTGYIYTFSLFPFAYPSWLRAPAAVTGFLGVPDLLRASPADKIAWWFAHNMPLSWSFRNFRPTNLHGGSPINMPLSCRTEHRPTLQHALLPRCRSCSLLLGAALNPPLPDRRRFRAGRLLPYDVFLLGVVVSGAPMRSSALLRS